MSKKSKIGLIQKGIELEFYEKAAARVWSPYKELLRIVESAVLRKQPDAIQDLELALRKHKPDFISLLLNPAKSTVAREAVRRAHVEGLVIQGQQATQLLTTQFIDEALILSDLFNLNEYAAVELLLAGETQQAYFLRLTRGLVAVLLYYDGRASVVAALRLLIQSRAGRTWALGHSQEVTALTSKFTDEIMKEQLIGRILDVLGSMDLTAEVDKLQKERALGHARHRQEVVMKMKEIRLSLAECLFCWSCQMPLEKAATLRLLTYLRSDGSSRADGSLEDVTLALLMALLYSLDVRLLDQEDSEEVTDKLPLISDPTFLPAFQQELVSGQKWANPGLRAVVQLAWALTLRYLSNYPGAPDFNDYCDEAILDMAIKDDVFRFLTDSVVATEMFHREEYYVRQLHSLITDLLTLTPLKVKEMRNRGDEAARIIIANRQEGLEPPANLSCEFEHLVKLISAVYEKDLLGLQLSADFWCPPDPLMSAEMTQLHSYRPPQKQISLFKFVRLAGDLLPPPLFIPYIDMLAGLASGPQSAHYCFSLLKSNGMTAGGETCAVSWDHFFISLNQYYASLRQEAPAYGDLAHVYRHHLRGITPQEVDGLRAVLHLTRTVAEQDENSRISLCENQHWLLTVVLVGLVGCSVPTSLKSELLLTLAALAQTPEVAARLWQALEVAQILPTVSTSNLQQQPAGGIQVELDEIEARNEEYPLTRAFLHLMKALTDRPIPAGLGIGHRAPGFQPYLEFLRDFIFHKFDTRAYKDPAEKWQVGALVLDVLHKLLASHQVCVEDFVEMTVEVQGEVATSLPKPPGHTLMLHMMNDTKMLRKILYIIDEAVRQLDKFSTFPGKEHLEQTAFLCLKMLNTTLEKEGVFLDALRDTGASVMVSTMDKLLIGINPRSGKADHLVNIAKYVTYSHWLPNHALLAVKILCAVCRSALIQPKIVGLFTASESITDSLLHGFVQCLESEDPEDLTPEQEEDDVSSTETRSATRQHILKLLMVTLEQPAPNLAHFLLGFQLRQPVSKTNLQDPGVLGSARTCLHSVLTLVERGMDSRSGPSCLQDMPRSAELTYQLIYMLCANKDTSNPTMRYLRTAHDFLYRHLKHLPFQTSSSADLGTDADNHSEPSLKPQSWLLKAIAIELRLTSANKQRSHTHRLLSLLLDDTPTLETKVLRTETGLEPAFSLYDIEYTMYSSLAQPSTHQTLLGGQSRRKILDILDSIDFSHDYPSVLELEYFNPSLIEQVLTSCEQQNEAGLKLCNVHMLHQILTNELNNLQATAMGQRPLIMQEVTAVCANMVERNGFRLAVHSKRQAFESWRQVVEVLLTACPEDQLLGETRQAVIFELLQDLLIKVSKPDAIPELTRSVAGVILTLMANLRQCFLADQLDKSHLDGGASGYIQPADSCTLAAADLFDVATGTRTLFASSLQVVLKGLIEHIIHSSSSSQRVRANLYGALLYYLQIAAKPHRLTTTLDSDDSSGVCGKLTGKESEFEKLMRENISTICSYGHNFMEVVCRDASDGHDVGRMLALASLDCILCIDHAGNWLSYLSTKGYLQHIVDSLLQDDQQLQAMLQPSPEPLRALYILESKIGLLTRVAESTTGAHTLLQYLLMTRLAQCTIFDLRPEVDRPTEEDSFIPSMLSRYRQHIMFPVLKLCLAILTSLGIEHRQAASQVLRFLASHVDVFSGILRDRQSSLNLESLTELSLVTAVLSRAAVDPADDAQFWEDAAHVELRGHLSRLHRQMLALLPKYCLTDKLQKKVVSLESSAGHDQHLQAKLMIAIQQISANVTAFCRTVISRSGTTSHLVHILFGPSLLEAMARDIHNMDEVQSSFNNSSQPHNLGVIVYMLRQSCTQFMVVYDSHKQTLHKLKTLPDLGTEEVKELCGNSAQTSDKLSAQQRQSLAQKRLVQIAAHKVQQLQLFSYIVENCVYVLWKHLDFYLLHCVPADTGNSLYKLNARRQHIRDLRGDGATNTGRSDDEDVGMFGFNMGVSREELDQLKQDANMCINEALLKKVQEIEQLYCRSHSRYGFLEALVRRIKRLLRLHTGAS